MQYHVILFALKVSQSLYYVTPAISQSVAYYFPRLWGMDISDAIFCQCFGNYVIGKV